MFLKIVSTLFFLAAPLVSLTAGVRVYMIPRVYTLSEGLRVADIARIEGRGEDVARIAGEIIPVAFTADGLIDRNELRTVLIKTTGGVVKIYGSASRIIKSIAGMKEGEVLPGERGAGVKRGERVKVIVKKGGIIIEVAGKAERSGSPGDEIPVLLKRNRRIKGRITGRNSVEVEL